MSEARGARLCRWAAGRLRLRQLCHEFGRLAFLVEAGSFVANTLTIWRPLTVDEANAGEEDHSVALPGERVFLQRGVAGTSHDEEIYICGSKS